jgi:GT2 family glycosyltransferase
VSSRFQRMLLEQACSLNAAPPVSLPPTLQPTPAFAGCAWMVPTKVLSKVGLLREDLFLYHEELEYAVRLKRTGFLCGRLGAGGGQVRHWGGMAEGLSPSQAYYSSRNLVRLLDGLPPAVRPRLLAAATGSVVWRALRCLAAGRPLSAANCARGLVDGFRGARGELGNRERRGRQ